MQFADDILLRADDEGGIKALFTVVDAIEQSRIDPCAVPPIKWSIAANRLAARQSLPVYTPERHAAHVAGEALK
jgi:hypothetical protein